MDRSVSAFAAQDQSSEDRTTLHVEKLRKEAEFQNQRIRNFDTGLEEVRDRFYYLASRAGRHYEDLLEM